MLQLMPYLSKLTPENLVPLNLEDFEDKYIIINCHKVLQPYQPEVFSKCIIRIPEEETEEISIYQYPLNNLIPLEELISLFDGKIEENEERSYSEKELKSIAKERKHIRECNFTSHGCYMKILLYDRNHGDDDSMQENDRAKAVFMSRDDRVFRMAGIKNKPSTIPFFTNDLLSHNIMGESEIITGDVLLVVEQ